MNVVIFTCVSNFLFQRSIGAYQIAHFLRSNNFSVQVIDFTDYFTEEELINLVNKFLNHDTLAVGISTTFYTEKNTNWGFADNHEDKFEIKTLPGNLTSTLSYIKDHFPKIKIVLGGSKSYSTKLDIVDKTISGYAEQEFLEYLNEIKGSKKISNLYRQHQLFSIQSLDHKFTPQDCIIQGETLPIEISRGCIFKCKFCAFPLNGKTKLDYIRDPEKIKEEMIYNYENFNVTNYFFSDDTFNDSTEKIENLLKVIKTLPFKIKFTTYLRLDLLYHHQEQIRMLKEMGLATAFFGIETFNQRTANCIGKGMNTSKTKDFILDLYNEHWNKGIPITCSFIVGLPYESKESVLNTFEWVKDSNINSMFFPLAITKKGYYKSEFDLNYQKYGYIVDPDTEFWTTEYFTFEEARSMAKSFNDELMRKHDSPSGWFLMSLLNNGYSYEEAVSLKMQDLNIKRILRAKLNNIENYKKMITHG